MMPAPMMPMMQQSPQQPMSPTGMPGGSTLPEFAGGMIPPSLLPPSLPYKMTMQPRLEEDPSPVTVPDELLTDRYQEIITCIESAKGILTPYVQEIVDNRNLYKPKQARLRKPYPEAFELAIPMLVYTTNALVARLRRALFSVQPLHSFEGDTEYDRLWSPGLEEFFTKLNSAEYVNLVDAAYPILYSGLQDGFGVGYWTWETDIRRRRRFALVSRPVVDPFSGQAMMMTRPQIEIIEEEFPFRDWPKLHHVMIEDLVWYPPQARDFSQAIGVAMEIQKTGAEILRGMEAGDYDPRCLAALQEWKGDDVKVDSELQQKEISGQAEQPRNFQNRTYTLKEGYWIFPESNDPNAPSADYWFTLHEGSKSVLRMKQNPWWSRERTLVSYTPLPGKYGPLGRSVPDLMGAIQSGSNELLNLFLDALALDVAPPLKVRRGTMSKGEMHAFQHRLGPRSIWELDDPENVKALERERGENPNMGLALFETLRQIGARALSLDNVHLGAQTSRQATATEIEEMLAEGEVQFGEISDHAARFLARCGKIERDMCYQMSGRKSVQDLWAIVNGPDPSGLVALIALGGAQTITAAGGADAGNKALRKKRAEELYQILLANPLVGNNLPRVFAVTQHLLSEYDVRYQERFIGTEADAMMQQQFMQAMQSAMLVAQGQQQNGPNSPQGGE